MNTISIIKPRRIGHSIINSERRIKLLSFCVDMHFGQKRKYTEEPYINHPFTVAVKANHLHALAWEIALLHDVKEDCNISWGRLFNEIMEAGYNYIEASFIRNHLYELTDLFTAKAFPELNRKKRKYLESTRLAEISPLSQSIKYCDLLDNTGSIVNYDTNFAKVYLPEKELVLSLMNKGDQTLYNEAVESLKNAKLKLNGKVR